MSDALIDTIARSIAMDVHHDGARLNWSEEERARLWSEVREDKRAYFRIVARAAIDAAKAIGFELVPHGTKQAEVK